MISLDGLLIHRHIINLNMTFLSVGLFMLGVSSQGLLFWRASRWGGWRTYPFFYTYLAYTAFWTIVFLFFPHSHPLYPKLYWYSDLVAAVLRFLVAWEVFRAAFQRGTVVRKVAGRIVLAALLLLALVYWWSGPSPGFHPIADYMRKMALAASVWTFLVLAIVWFYGIRIGPNLWGMAIGFLVFVSSEIVTFSGFGLAPGLNSFWRYVHPFSYAFMLTVWVWSLWDYVPNLQTQFDSPISSRFFSRWQRQSQALNEAIRRVTRP